jgi:hypothetical protein
MSFEFYAGKDQIENFIKSNNTEMDIKVEWNHGSANPGMGPALLKATSPFGQATGQFSWEQIVDSCNGVQGSAEVICKLINNKLHSRENNKQHQLPNAIK